MDAEKYLSIKKFAETANVSTQALYKRINKDLKPYLKFEGNVRKLSTKALSLFATDQSTLQSVEQVCNQQENENVIFKLIKSSEEPEEHTKKKPVFEVMLLSLKNQLEIKDNQLIEKDKQLIEKDKQIESITKALLNAQLSAQQAQVLHAGTIKQVAIEESTCATGCKQGFFSKLFSRKH